MRRRRWLLGFVLVAVAVVVAAGLVARSLVERSLSAALSVPVAVGWLWWDPWTRQFSAGDVALGSGDDRITAESVAFEAELSRILRGELWIDRIDVEAPTAALRIGSDNQVHFTAFGESPGAAAASGPGRPVFVREIAVVGGELVAHYPISTGMRTAKIAIGRFTASNLEVESTPQGTQVSVSGVLDGSINGAPVEGDVVIRAGKERDIQGKLAVKGLEVSREILDLPAAFSTFTAKVDAEAELDFTQKRDAVRLALRLEAPRFDGVEGTSFSAESILLPAAEVNITARAIDLGSVRVEAPVVTAVVADAAVVLPGTSTGAEAPVTTPQQPGWSVTSGLIETRGGELRARRGEAGITLALESARWEGIRGARPGRVEASGELAEGGSIAITGTAAADPLALQLDVRLEAAPLVPLSRLAPSLPASLAKGTAEGTLRVAFGPGLQELGGRAVLRDVATAPPDPSRSLEVLAVHAADFAFSYVPAGGKGEGRSSSLDLSILRLSYPYAMVHRHRGGTFPYSLVAGSGDDSATPAGGPGQVAVAIDRLEVESGKVEIVDATQEPSYWASLTGVAAEVVELRYPESTVAHLRVTGKHDELSPAELRGSFGAGGFVGRATVQDVLLQSLNPYVAPVLGYSITTGRLSIDAVLTSEPPLLQSKTEVVLVGVDVLQTGLDAIQQQSGVPLPVAIGLLENTARVIRLELPLVIDTAARQISVGSVVWQAVRGAIAGALTYPLRALGSLFGTRGSPHAFAVDPIPFAVGEETLDAAGTARVAEIARIVHAHRGLLLILLAQISAQDVGAVGAAGAQALAEGRSAAVRDALVAGDAGPAVDEDRVIVAGWTPDKGAGATGKPGVYVELQDGD